MRINGCVYEGATYNHKIIRPCARVDVDMKAKIILRVDHIYEGA